MPAEKASNLTAVHHTAIGAFAGAVEVCVMQPTVAVKNALQEGRAIPRAPGLLYRGLGINAGSMAPITAVQFGSARLYEDALSTFKGGKLAQGERIGVAAFAGATSSLISSPAELLMIQQQRTGDTLSGAARRVISTYGVSKMYRGIGATAMRESLYVGGYMGLMPALRDFLAVQPSFQQLPNGSAIAAAGVTAGLLAAAASQPADTVKTRMQALLDSKAAPEYATLRSTISHVTQTGGGASALWAGFTPRAVRTVGAVFILTFIRDFFVNTFDSKPLQS